MRSKADFSRQTVPRDQITSLAGLPNRGENNSSNWQVLCVNKLSGLFVLFVHTNEYTYGNENSGWTHLQREFHRVFSQTNWALWVVIPATGFPHFFLRILNVVIKDWGFELQRFLGEHKTPWKSQDHLKQITLPVAELGSGEQPVKRIHVQIQSNLGSRQQKMWNVLKKVWFISFMVISPPRKSPCLPHCSGG